jgi:hypothetical protein
VQAKNQPVYSVGPEDGWLAPSISSQIQAVKEKPYDQSLQGKRTVWV